MSARPKLAKELPVTWDMWTRIAKKNPAGRRTWWIAIRRPPRCNDVVVQHKGNFPDAVRAAQERAQKVPDASEIVVLL